MKFKDLVKILQVLHQKNRIKLNYNSKDLCFVKPCDISEKAITHLNHTEYYIGNLVYNS